MKAPAFLRDLSIALVIIGGVAALQAIGPIIPASRSYGFGGNQFGELGRGNISAAEPTAYGVAGGVQFTQLDGGAGTSIGISNKGNVYTWGRATAMLGYASTGETKPMQVTLPLPALSVSMGQDHALAVLTDGRVFSWGANTSGQLGRAGVDTPLAVPGITGFTQVSAGGSFSLALNASGDVYAWGLNNGAQLTAAPPTSSVRHISSLPDVTAISAGGAHALALAADGTVFAWGSNSVGQATGGGVTVAMPTQVPTLNDVVAIAAGSSFSLALKSDGTVWAWGQSQFLGARAVANSSLPVQVLFDNNGVDEPLTGITGIAAGTGFALALRNDGRWVGWGSNNSGQLGLGTTSALVPVARLAPALSQPATGVAAGGTQGFVTLTDPLMVGSFNASPSVACNGLMTTALTLDGLSVTGGQADVMLTIDDSGSLSADEFASLEQFAINLVNVLNVAPTGTRVGIVMFGTDSRLVLAPTGNRATVVSTLQNLTRIGGATCIGCGLNQSDQALDDNPRTGASRVIVVLTDGVNNEPYPQSNADAYLAAAITAAQAANAVVAVGIGDGIDIAELNAIASDLPGLQTMFTTPNFNLLDLLVDSLAASITAAGATNASVGLDFNPSWALQLAYNPSIPGTTVTRSGNHVSWVVPSLDHNGARLTFQLRAVTGGAQPLLTAATYDDDQGHGATFANPTVDVHGCFASIALAPAASTGLINSSHTVTATALDHYGAPLPNVNVGIHIVAGPKAGFLGSGPTNASGQFSRTYTSAVPGTDVIEAYLVSNVINRSNSATRVWDTPNHPPIANAGPDRVVHLPANTVLLDGSASIDDGKPSGVLSYSWNGGPFISGPYTAPLVHGQNVFQLQVSDGQLVSGFDTVMITLIDPTPPLVTPHVVGTLGSNDWYTSNVSLTWDVDDPESVSESSVGCGPRSVVADTDGVAFTCTATNDDAAQTSMTVSIKRDATAPVVTTAVNVHAAAASPAGSIVTYADASATDAMSGLAGSAICAPASGSLFAMGTTDVTCTAVDGAGNIGSGSFIVVVEDTSPPEISAVVTGAPGSNGWFTSPVQIVWTVSDPQSTPLATGCDPVTLSADTPGVTVTCSATSAGGAASADRSVKIDQAGPVISPPSDINTSTTNAAGAIVDYQSPTASDSPSGVAGGVTCVPASGSTFAIGATPVSCTATDAAGNASTASFTVNVRLLDSTPPSIVPSVIGTLGSNGWYRGNVAISFAVNDGESAITSSSGCGAITVSSDTAGQTFTCTATSEGGTSSQFVTVKRDATAPSLTTSGNLTAAATSNTGVVVTYAAPSANDGTSGLDSPASCAPASGSTFAIGVTTVNCGAADKAGNTVAASFTITVTDPGAGSNEPGRMHGQGHVIVDNHRVLFDFSVLESARKGERARVDLRISRGRNGRWDDDRFDSHEVSDVSFANAPSYAPGKNPKTGIDTVVFAGTGKWDRRDGYTYVVTASDRGEPGRGADTFTIEVRAPNGQVVFSGGGAIADGNVQSNRVKR